MKPRLALLPGEPAGIGPELCVRLAQAERPAELIAIADRDTLLAAAEALRLPLVLRGQDEFCRAGELALIHRPLAKASRFGHLEPDNARSVIDALLFAAQACEDKRFDGMVTGPIHKANINAGGIAYSGTTELLAQHADAPVVMMLATETLRVALATTHLPLRAVADAISTQLLDDTIRVLEKGLRLDFGITSPRITVLGLNPHAGEDGVLGHEENDIIIPLLNKLRLQGIHVIGPMPADTAFLPRHLAACDAVLAMYHDQGLPVLKHVGFENAVNITLGLPYPRVAVDHGTALDLAGLGVADPSSLIAATALCSRLALNRRAS